MSGRKSGLFSVVMNPLSVVLAAILSRVIFKERLAGVLRQTITQRGLEFVLRASPSGAPIRFARKTLLSTRKREVGVPVQTGGLCRKYLPAFG